MKRFVFLLTTIFMCSISHAETFNQYWYVENNTPIQTTCETGGDIILPNAPTKYGYDFIGWEKLSIKRIEYLESTGTQYISADVLDENPYLHVKAGVSASKYAHMGLISGKGVSFYQTPSRYFALWMGYELTHTSIALNTRYDADYIITPTNITFTINNNTKQFSGYNLSNDKVLRIANAGATATYAKFYYVQVLDSNDVLLADFIPVLDGNGVPCMYDRVEKKFYYNAGTGQFIAGPVIGE